MSRGHRTSAPLPRRSESSRNGCSRRTAPCAELRIGKVKRRDEVVRIHETFLARQVELKFGGLGVEPAINQARISNNRADWSGGITGAPIGMKRRSWVKMMRSFNGRLRALAPWCRSRKISPSSQMFAG